MRSFINKLLYSILFFSFSGLSISEENKWIDLKNTPEGMLVRFVINNQTIGLLHRKKEVISQLLDVYQSTMESEENKNLIPALRSIKPEYFIFVDIGFCSSHCYDGDSRVPYGLTYISDSKSSNGLVDKCAGIAYDFSGRAKHGKPYLLQVPPHKFISDTEVEFGSF